MAAEIEQTLSACKRPILVSGSIGSGKADVFKHLAASLGLCLQQACSTYLVLCVTTSKMEMFVY